MLTHRKVREGFEGVNGFPFGRAYGWRNALTLAKRPGQRLNQVAQRNADSIALFAAGIRLLNQDPPLFIRDDGSVNRDIVLRRAVMPRELNYPVTPAAFGAFITMVREDFAGATGLPADLWLWDDIA